MRRVALTVVALAAGLSCNSALSDQSAATASASAKSAPNSTENLADPSCLPYGDTVQVRGTVLRETHPGRPNFESVAAGDRAEVGFYLHLEEPVCTRARAVDVPDEMSTDSVTRVQLVLGPDGYSELRAKLGTRVVMRGILFSAFTGHHHAPLLLMWPELLP